MTSRRSRIKGIANIPQRRKQINEETDIKLKKSETDVKTTSENEVENNLIKNTSGVTGNLTVPFEGSNRNENISENITDSRYTTTKTLKNNEGNNFPELFEKTKVANNSAAFTSSEVNSSDLNKNDENSELALKKPSENKSLLLKRKFLKIPVSLSAIQKNKRNVSHINEKLPPSSNQPTESEEESKKVTIIQEKLSGNGEYVNFAMPTKEIQILEEIAFVPNIAENSSENRENIFQKPLSVMNNTAHSDSEYPLPPPSPNKANRTRIKAIPRLAHRKTSFSASESEDESRKINRIRNDSICSTTSIATESLTECFSPQRQRDALAAIIPKKSGRSEQTRKLAEARREFIRRFGANKPERHRLTMMDLIFYNPDSNPMTNDNNKDVVEDDSEQLKHPDDPELEEIEDNPSPTEEAAKSDEENAMPVPQIKIGPSGEIILDEQSLVIERKDVQRQREEMEKTKVVDADKFKTGYGIYKKHRRSKYWSHSETLRFYKALNTIGTDFMLMCELFPTRARRELKIKFKKEEKLNRHLIDRALMQPCSFDFEDLKNEIETEERELEELRKQKEEQKKQKDEKKEENLQKMIEKVRKRKADEMAPKPKPNQVESATNEKEKVNVISKVKSKKMKKENLSIKSFMSDSDADESDLATQSESDEDVVLSRKPTRSGRLPKIVQRYENEQSSINCVMKKNRIPDHAQPSNVEPGSIMIISENGPNGEPVYKIYMVTPEQKATRLELSSDIISKAIQLKKGVTAESIMTISANVTDDEDMPQENNITIPADENVTTLKTDVTKNIPTENGLVETAIKNLDQKRIDNESENQNIKVIATEKDNCFRDDLVILNDFNEVHQILLEVKSDGSCSTINTKEIIDEKDRLEEKKVRRPADKSAVNVEDDDKSVVTEKIVRTEEIDITNQHKSVVTQERVIRTEENNITIPADKSVVSLRTSIPKND